MGASGQGDVKRRPRTEGPGSHMATGVTRKMAGWGLMRMTISQGLKSSIHKKQVGVSDVLDEKR